MARIIAIIIVLLVSTGLVASQQISCPQIYVDGPMGTGEVGEPIPYSVRIEPLDKAVGLSYLWSVTTSRGELGMVRGQGTQTILVPWNDDAITVTIRVIGVPRGCPETASSSTPYESMPVAEKLDEFVGPLSKVLKTRFDTVLAVARRNPTAQLYIVVAGKRGNISKSIRSKRSSINSLLVDKLIRSGHKAVMVDSDRVDDRVTIWLLPAGAEHPKR